MPPEDLAYEVVVVGAGNAALCAALSARDHGATVAIVEKAPRSEQGGNCPFTGGGFRFVHNGIEDLSRLVDGLTGDELAGLSMAPYTAEDYWEHLMAVTQGETDPELMEALISQSRPTIEWMRSKGVQWELRADRQPGDRAPSVIPNGVGLSAARSGPGLVQMLTTAARRAGVDVLYETRMLRLLQDSSGRVCGVAVQDADGAHELRSHAVVLACGGFEANPEMRKEHLGAGWEQAKVRGSKHNSGDGHRAALEIGAKPGGRWTGCHATPIDMDAPATGILETTEAMPRRSYPLGITVNLDGRRFVDEGSGFAEQTFTHVGRRILKQPTGVAFQIFDANATPLLEPRYGVSTPVEADTIRSLAERLGIDPSALSVTVDAFNAEAHDATYRPRELDGRSTGTLEQPKSNWAIKIDAPPFAAYRVTGGITYTYGGLAITATAEVLDLGDSPIPGLFAAGEIVGGIFYHNSLRAAGLMHGSVFGRAAGANAARSLAPVPIERSSA